MDQLIPTQDSEVFNDEVCEGIHEIIRFDTQYNVKAKTILTSMTILYLLQNVTMFIHPSLPTILISDLPPSIADLLALPTVANLDPAVWKTHFMIYLLVMAKPGCRYLIYIGSAASLTHGLAARLQDYFRGSRLPRWVQHFLDQGYEIVLISPLMMFKMDNFVSSPEFHAFLLALEAMFTYRLWAVYQSPRWSGEDLEKQHYMSCVCPWKIADLEYGGLASHSPVSERLRGQEILTMDEIVRLAKIAKDKDNEKRRELRAAIREAREAREAGTADLSDPTVQFLLQYWDSTKNTISIYKAKRFKDFKLGQSLLDKADQEPSWIPTADEENLMDFAKLELERLRGYKRREREVLERGRSLLLQKEAGEIQDLDKDDQRALKRATTRKISDKNYEQARRDGEDLLKQFADDVGPGGLTAYVPNEYETRCLHAARAVRAKQARRFVDRKNAAVKRAADRFKNIVELASAQKTPHLRIVTRGSILIEAIKYGILDETTLSSEDTALVEKVRIKRIIGQQYEQKKRNEAKEAKQAEINRKELSSDSDSDLTDLEDLDVPEAMDLDSDISDAERADDAEEME